MEKEEAKFLEKKKQEEFSDICNKEDLGNKNKLINIGDTADENLALLNELAEVKNESITQLLKRKKLSEEEEDNDKTV